MHLKSTHGDQQPNPTPQSESTTTTTTPPNDATNSTGPPNSAIRSTYIFLKRWVLRSALSFAAFLITYALAAWTLSNIPTNPEFVSTEDGVEIGLTSNGVHVNFILPATNSSHDWRDDFLPSDFLQNELHPDWVVIGWGNKRFYLETPRWSDLRIQTVAESLAGFGETAMHVEWKLGKQLDDETTYRIRLSHEQYRVLCNTILSSFHRNPSGKLFPISGEHYRTTDAFYEAKGHYHIFNTCNVWIGECLKKSGVRVGYWTPTPSGVMASLPPELPPRNEHSQ